MDKIRRAVQVALIVICFVSLKRTENFSLKLTLYIVCVSLLVQEFLKIFNAEMDENVQLKGDKYKYLRLFGIVVVELLILLGVYYLSTLLMFEKNISKH